MQLIQALQQNRNVKANIGNVTIVIEQAEVECKPEDNQCYWHHTLVDGEMRRHSYIYGSSIQDLIDDIYERDDGDTLEDEQLEAADWQAGNKKMIDMRACNCLDCYDFHREYDTNPPQISYEEWKSTQGKFESPTM